MILMTRGGLFRIAVFAICIVISITITRTNANIALIWLPNAAAIFLCVDEKRSLDWEYAVAFFVTNLLINLGFGDGLAFSSIISLTNQIEVWTVIALLRLWTLHPVDMGFEVRLFRTFAALVFGPLASSPLGIYLQAAYFNIPPLEGFVHWYIADFTSMVIVGGYFAYRRSFGQAKIVWPVFGPVEIPAVLALMASLLFFQIFLHNHLYLVIIIPIFWVAMRLPNELGAILIAVLALGTMLLLPGVFGFSDNPTDSQQMEVLQAQIIIGIFVLTGNIAHQLNHFNVDAIKQLETVNRELEQSRAYYRLAEKASQLGHWRIDRLTDTYYWSDMVHKIHGTDPETFVPNACNTLGFVVEDDRERVLADVQKSIETRGKHEFVFRIKRVDGTIRTLQSIGEVMVADGQATTLFGVVQDLTERKREEQLRIAYSELERFSYACSHDLSEPTRLISVLTDMLIEDEGPNPEPNRADLLKSINRNARRLNELVTNLLTFSRLGLETERAEVNLDDVADHVLDALSLVIAEKNAITEAQNLGTASGSDTHFRQIFQNLVSNALRHGHFKKPAEIRILRTAETDHIHLVVGDNGETLSPAAQEKLALALAPAEAHRPKGRGLGLWIAANIVRRYKGDIWYQQGAQGGTEIHVTLPHANPTERMS